MEKKVIFKITASEETFDVDVFDKDKTIAGLVDWVCHALDKQDKGPLNLLLSACVHVLALDFTNDFAEEFFELLKNESSKYRELYYDLLMKYRGGKDKPS